MNERSGFVRGPDLFHVVNDDYDIFRKKKNHDILNESFYKKVEF